MYNLAITHTKYVSDIDLELAMKRARIERSRQTVKIFKSIFNLFKKTKHKPKPGYTSTGVACAL